MNKTCKIYKSCAHVPCNSGMNRCKRILYTKFLVIGHYVICLIGVKYTKYKNFVIMN